MLLTIFFVCLFVIIVVVVAVVSGGGGGACYHPQFLSCFPSSMIGCLLQWCLHLCWYHATLFAISLLNDLFLVNFLLLFGGLGGGGARGGGGGRREEEL